MDVFDFDLDHEFPPEAASLPSEIVLSADLALGSASPIAEQLELELPGPDALTQSRAVRARYLATNPPLRSYLDFANFQSRMRAIGLAAEPTDYFLDHATLFLAPMGTPSVLELAGIASLPVEVARETIRRMRNEAGYSRRSPRNIILNPTSFGRDDLRSLLRPALHNLPGTWLCADEGDEHDALPGAAIMRLSALRHDAIREAAALETVLYAAENPAADVSVVVSGFERLDDAFHEAGLDPGRSADVLTLFERYGILDEVLVTHAPGPRLTAIARWMDARWRIGELAKEHPALARPLASVRLSGLPRGRRAVAFEREYRKRRKRYCADCAANRKKDAFDLADSFAARLAAIQLRSTQAIRMWRECSAAETWMRANMTSGRRLFSWNEDVLSAAGRRTGGLQQLVFEAIFRDELEAELDDCVPQPRFRFVKDDPGSTSTPLPGPKTIGANRGREIVFRFVEVQAERGRAQEPWFVDYCRKGVLVAPAGIPIEMREARRALYIAHRLPLLHYRPGGLVGPEGRAQALFMRRALVAGVVLVPVAPFAHAMAISAVSLRTMALTLARVGELLQIVHRPGEDAWTQVDVPGRGKRPAWMAIQKGGGKRVPFVVYDDRTMPLLRVLIDLMSYRDALSKVPVSKPCQALARKIGEDVYVIAFRGRMLSAGDLNYMHRFLLGGIQRVRNHDLRHASANRSEQEHAMPAEIAWRLKHAGAVAGLPPRGPGFAQARAYSQASPAQQRESFGNFTDARRAFEIVMGVPLRRVPA